MLYKVAKMPVVWGILFSIVIQFTLLLHKQNIIVADIYHLPAIICLPYLKYCHLRTQDHSSRSCSLWTQVYTHLTNCCHQPGTAKEKHRFTLPKHVAWNNKTCGMEQQNMWHGTTNCTALFLYMYYNDAPCLSTKGKVCGQY